MALATHVKDKKKSTYFLMILLFHSKTGKNIFSKMEPKMSKEKNSPMDIPNPILKDFYGSKENSKRKFSRSDSKIAILFRRSNVLFPKDI